MKTDTEKKNVLSGVRGSGMRTTVVADLINVTWRMTVPTVAGIAIGVSADNIFGSSPIGFLVGAALGFGIGIYMAVRMLKAVSEAEK